MMKKIIAIMALGLAFSTGAWAVHACNPMTGTIINEEGMEVTPVVNCTPAQMSPVCEVISYDSHACRDFCVAGTIGDANKYCLEAREYAKANSAPAPAPAPENPLP